MKNNLPCWKKFSEALKSGKSAREFGFECKDGDISRINARYRLVKSFKGLELEGYSLKTLDRYNSLFRIFLAYSLFEVYLNKALGIDNNFYKKAYELLGEEGRELSKKIFRLDRDKKFYSFLYEYLESNTQKKEIENFINNKEHNVVYLIAAIRHIFSHGILPANRLVAPKKITDAIFEVLVGFIEKDFVSKVCKDRE